MYQLTLAIEAEDSVSDCAIDFAVALVAFFLVFLCCLACYYWSKKVHW